MTLSNTPFRLAFVIAAGMVISGVSGAAQSAAAPTGQRGALPATPVPTGRTGRGGYPLPNAPGGFRDLQHKVRVSVVARGLDRPWSLLILPMATCW